MYIYIYFITYRAQGWPDIRGRRAYQARLREQYDVYIYISIFVSRRILSHRPVLRRMSIAPRDSGAGQGRLLQEVAKTCNAIQSGFH